jgi:hypothetical protein
VQAQRVPRKVTRLYSHAWALNFQNFRRCSVLSCEFCGETMSKNSERSRRQRAGTKNTRNKRSGISVFKCLFRSWIPRISLVKQNSPQATQPPPSSIKSTEAVSVLDNYNIQKFLKPYEYLLITNYLRGARTRMFITVFTRARHRSLFWATWIQSTLPQPISLRSILIPSSHLRLGLPSGLSTYLWCLKIITGKWFRT